MPEKVIMNQPELIYADTYKDFLNKNNLENCYPIKNMYHQCMSDNNQKFNVCDYIYSMMFICSTLEFKDFQKKKI
jgi:hypothetical protein